MQLRLFLDELRSGRFDGHQVCEVQFQEDGLFPRVALELCDRRRRLVRVIRRNVYLRVALQEHLHVQSDTQSACRSLPLNLWQITAHSRATCSYAPEQCPSRYLQKS